MTNTKAFRPYALTKPCKDCPFRTDVDPYLRPNRASEIADSIQRGADFPCHKTTAEDPEDDSVRVATTDSKTCAGSLILQAKTGQFNQMARIGMRIGVFDPDALDLDAPVPDSWGEWVSRFRPEGQPVLDHCGVAGPNCEDPVGWMAGGVIENTDPGTCEVECSSCGHFMCDDCTSEEESFDGPLCIYCTPEDGS